MTDKEKAKAYDEALDRMKYVVVVPKNEEALQALKETIFPELAESEDERIRKGLIQYLKELREWKVGTMVPIRVSSHYDAWIAYLEKQKEQTADNQFPPLEGLDAIKAKYYDKGFKCGFDEGIDSVKPTEWSDEDENNLELVIDCIYKFYPDPVMKYKLKEWLKSLRPSKDCSSCAKNLEGYISGRSDAENKLLEQFGALITPEDELHIKPRWKPSEEQMEALKKVTGNAVDADEYYPALATLYYDLKEQF